MYWNKRIKGSLVEFGGAGFNTNESIFLSTPSPTVQYGYGACCHGKLWTWEICRGLESETKDLIEKRWTSASGQWSRRDLWFSNVCKWWWRRRREGLWGVCVCVLPLCLGKGYLLLMTSRDRLWISWYLFIYPGAAPFCFYKPSWL